MQEAIFLLLILSASSLTITPTTQFSVSQTPLVEPPHNPQAQKLQIDDDTVNITNITLFPQNYKGVLRAGYLNVSDFDKSFYYILAESLNENRPQDDPVVLWLNGGPGCSSMTGFLTENGPFKFKENSTEMYINPYSWNQRANVIYLQSPGSVGFSYASGKALSTNDTQTAKDNLLALRVFFDRYTHFRGNAFYLAGESYAGIYIPQLAAAILQYNQDAEQLRINLQGILLGNPCTHPTQCYTPFIRSRYFMSFLYTRGFYQAKDYLQYQTTCAQESSQPCKSTQSALYNKFLATRANIYNIYGKCYNRTYPPQLQQKILRSQQLTHALRCSDAYGPLYLFNQNEFREALRVYEMNDTLKWTPCSDVLDYKVEADASYSTLPTLIAAGLKVFYFSGDHDAIVPITGTLTWLQLYRKEYGAAVKRNWRPWTTQGEVAGMLWQLDGITFASVIGAGHMVPTDKPQQAFEIFQVFLGEKQWDA